MPLAKCKKVIIRCPTCNKMFEIYPYEAKNQSRKYCSYKCRNKGIMSGSKNPRWKGGVAYIGKYKYVLAPLNHPNKTQAGYILESRLIMENKLGRYLEPHEKIHHINGDPSDNRIENLILLTQRLHVHTHWQNKTNAKYHFLSDILWLKSRYSEQNWSIKQIAREIGCAPSSVRGALQKYNLYRPPLVSSL